MEKLGFIGVGMMGKPMAKNLLKEGYEPWSSEEVKEDVGSVLDEGAVGTPITIIRLGEGSGTNVKSCLL